MTTVEVAPRTPEWLLRSEVGLCPCGCIGKRSNTGFVAKTLESATGLLHEAVFAEDVAHRPGMLQRTDVRVKLVVTFALLISVSLVRHMVALIAMYPIVLVIAALSKVSVSFFIKRVWLFVPIFTGIVVLPATLNVITAGRIVVPLGTWFGHRIGLTEQGLSSGGLIVARVALSISLVVLLTLTTPWNRLLAALRTLFVPKMFILVLGMAYRYLFHLLGSVSDMYTARKARTVNRDNNTRRGRAFVASTAGALFGKSHALSEEVHQAMVSRGFTGNPRALRSSSLRRYDIGVGAAGFLLVAITLVGDHAFG